MKKILYLVTLSLLIISCSGGNSEVNVDEVVKSKDLNKIKSSREIVHKEYEKLVAELAKLDKAIAELDPNKKNPLVKTITVKDTLFNHYIEIQGNVETKENIVISPEYSGILTQLYVKAGQKVSKGQMKAKTPEKRIRKILSRSIFNFGIIKFLLL